MKNFITIVIVLALVGVGIYLYKQKPSPKIEVPTETTQTPSAEQTAEVVPKTEEKKESTVLGRSVDGRDITAYHYGSGEKELLFVGGIHGGYSWNTVLVAYELMDYLKANPDVVPSNIKVTVIPVLNPDGLKKVVGTAERFTPANVSSSQTVRVSGRFNANKVDLSRNFDCNWKATGVWQTQTVSGGSKAFSEPESLALKNYVEKNKPSAAVVWYSSAGGVYASSCNGGIMPETSTLTTLYAKASGYPAYESYDFYETTGDAVNWLAKNKIPAISVLLTNHEDTEWSKNLKGIEALLQHYPQ